MNDPEPVPSPSFYGQTQFPPKRGGIFSKETGEPPRLFANPVSINLNPFKIFLGRRIAALFGADNDHLITGVAQRTCFLPHTSIQRDRQVLHHDQDGTLLHRSSESPE